MLWTKYFLIVLVAIFAEIRYHLQASRWWKTFCYFKLCMNWRLLIGMILKCKFCCFCFGNVAVVQNEICKCVLDVYFEINPIGDYVSMDEIVSRVCFSPIFLADITHSCQEIPKRGLQQSFEVFLTLQFCWTQLIVISWYLRVK